MTKNQSTPPSPDLDFSIKQIRRLITVPVIAFALSFFVALLATLGRQWMNDSELALGEVERLIQSQESLLTNEIFFHQNPAVAMRLDLLIGQIQSRYPSWEVCVVLTKPKGNPSYANCPNDYSKKRSTLLTKQLQVGNQTVATLELKAAFVSQDKWTIIKFFLLSFVLSALLAAGLVYYLGGRIKIRVVSPLLMRIGSESRKAGIAELASQVAHDIRSPLAALDMVLRDIKDFPEENRILVRSSTQRIRDIANNLIEQQKFIDRSGVTIKEDSGDKRHEQLLSSILDSIVSEKRTQFRSRPGIEIDFQISEASYGLFALIDVREIKRIISNLINNSVDAIADSGHIEVRLEKSQSGHSVVVISDDGKGIPSHVLQKLGQRGVSVGKEGSESGSGLGLYHARTTLESWGGSLSIESEVGRGSQVTLTFAPAATPEWFLDRIDLNKAATVVILDDDVSIHQVWNGRLESSAPDSKIIHFSSPDEFIKWHSDHSAGLYLFDYELLGFQNTGLDIIEQMGLAKRAVLVTSRFEELAIQSRCVGLGVRLCPKGLASIVPISVRKPKNTADAILIDDDLLVHQIWSMRARERGKILVSYNAADTFIAEATDYDLTLPIYIDSNLGNGVRGEEVAKAIFGLGFREIYLTTGYDASGFAEMAWIAGILPKDPPWS